MRSTISNFESLKQLNFFDYQENFVRVYGSAEEPWFSGKDVATILGYINTAKAIIDHVDYEDKCRLDEKAITERYDANNQGKMVLINESGLYSLILRSKKEEAKQFKRFVTSEILPSIRKNGFYKLPTEEEKYLLKKQTQELTLSNLKLAEEIFTSCGKNGVIDDRDRLLLNDLARNCVAGDQQKSKIVEDEWSVSRRLSEHFGVTSSKAHSKAKLCAFGKLLANKYRNTFGEQPIKRAQYVNGTTRLVNHYTVDAWESEYDEDMIAFWSI